VGLHTVEQITLLLHSGQWCSPHPVLLSPS
jgi:hypothetical protein